MRLLQSLLFYTSSLALLNPTAAHNEALTPRSKGADAISFTFQPDDSISGALTMHSEQTLEYFKNELGIDVTKLRNHPELFGNSPSGHYTFPPLSGVEGTLSWNLTGRDPASLGAYERLTCDDCAAICGGLAAVPFGFIICVRRHNALLVMDMAGDKIQTFQGIINGVMLIVIEYSS
ncbi:uncharacterized protein F4817DRAFT_313069 [Daldinia loculata]|uniref:uncharacterized protein n=1 Tax=Daldinia loculata TaxID=103429 RepID=UPI0020C40CCA|nr:uncharacterized protein F4817DRAFT_313069 [Daldinia loculata]KAI1650210.1 hypothetical protein F4817DRAFT_313069 [Daldinia loculata]